jgi:hypothetical protein
MRKTDNSNYLQGIRAENYFASLLNQQGIQYLYANSWYDFEIYPTGKPAGISYLDYDLVEVKSTSLTHGSQPIKARMGRFNFSLKEARDRIFDKTEKVWLCFIVRYKDQFILLGLCRATELKNRHFISLCQLEKVKLLDFDKWIQEIMR